MERIFSDEKSQGNKFGRTRERLAQSMGVSSSQIGKMENISHHAIPEVIDALKSGDIRVQWDPEKDISGNNLPYRSIQIGLRGEAVRRYVSEWITAVTDITETVRDLDARRQRGEHIAGLLPQERPYPLG